jgi:hypothetical protein
MPDKQDIIINYNNLVGLSKPIYMRLLGIGNKYIKPIDKVIGLLDRLLREKICPRLTHRAFKTKQKFYFMSMLLKGQIRCVMTMDLLNDAERKIIAWFDAIKVSMRKHNNNQNVITSIRNQNSIPVVNNLSNTNKQVSISCQKLILKNYSY